MKNEESQRKHGKDKKTKKLAGVCARGEQVRIYKIYMSEEAAMRGAYTYINIYIFERQLVEKEKENEVSFWFFVFPLQVTNKGEAKIDFLHCSVWTRGKYVKMILVKNNRLLTNPFLQLLLYLKFGSVEILEKIYNLSFS